jgi:2-polyprenyl-6-methoxyphenol hydroxylase-like FAD-dependent oxidoreductase
MAKEPGDLPRRPISPELSARILREAQERGMVFGEPFRILVENSDATTVRVFNSKDKEPFAHGTANNLPRGVVFIGDSNHAVTPFAGSGANMALLDGHGLAQCLCTHRSIDNAVAAYDRRSLPRARILLRNSHLTIAVAHATGWRWFLIHLLLQLLGFFKLLWKR